VRAALRDLFGRWGLPGRLRVDNGQPWGHSGDLPPALALWAIGLGVGMIWNRPYCPRDNARIERSHQTCQGWAEPERCADLSQLAAHLTRATTLQRERYPAIGGQSRLAAFPALARGGRPYDPAREGDDWDLGRVIAFLAQGSWARTVDAVGRISLYRRALRVGRRYHGQRVMVRLDPAAHHWVITAADGQELARHPAEEISRERILSLTVSARVDPPRSTRRAKLSAP
jgi:hypothetical protein